MQAATIPGTVARRGLATALGGWLALHAGCAVSPTPTSTLNEFMQAVQDEDVDKLYCLCGWVRDARPTREDFRAWFDDELHAYDEGRDAGTVALGGSGVPAVKLFALGKGTFLDYGPPSRAGGGARLLRTAARFGYDRLDLSRLSPGTTFYLNGVPPGRVHGVQVPYAAGEVSLEVLDRVTLEWTFVRGKAIAGCPERWTIAAVAPVEGSAVSRELTWIL